MNGECLLLQIGKGKLPKAHVQWWLQSQTKRILHGTALDLLLRVENGRSYPQVRHTGMYLLSITQILSQQKQRVSYEHKLTYDDLYFSH